MRVKHEAEMVKGPMYDYLGHFAQPQYLREGHNNSGIGVTPLGGGVLQIHGSDYEDTLARSGIGNAANLSYPLTNDEKYNMAVKRQNMNKE